MRFCLLSALRLSLLSFAAATYTVCPCRDGGAVVVRLNKVSGGNYSSHTTACDSASWWQGDGNAPKGWLAMLDNREKLDAAVECLDNCTRREKSALQSDRLSKERFWYGLRFRCNESAWLWEKDASLSYAEPTNRRECAADPPSDLCAHIERKGEGWESSNSECLSPYRGYLCEFDANSLPELPAIFETSESTAQPATTKAASKKEEDPQNQLTSSLENALEQDIGSPLASTIRALHDVRRSMDGVFGQGEAIAAANLMRTTDLVKKLAREASEQTKNGSAVETFAEELLRISSMALHERNAASWNRASKPPEHRNNISRTRYRPIIFARLLSRVFARTRNLHDGVMRAGGVQLETKTLEPPVSVVRENGIWTVVSVTFQNLSLLLRKTDGSSDALATDSQVLSHSVYDPRGKKVSVPVTFNLSAETASIGYNGTELKRPSCQFYDYDTQRWSDYGCHVLAVGDGAVTCHCNHTTVFAILLVNADARVVRLSSGARCYRMDLVHLLGYVCNSLSIAFLVLTVLSFRLVQTTSSAGKSERHVTHVNLSAAMLGLHFALLFSEVAEGNRHLCAAVTFVAHFFLIATFAWMTVEGLILYVYILRGNIRNQALGWRKYALGWGAPVVISVVALGCGLAQGRYIYDEHEERICWLAHERGLSWAATGPVLAALAVNAVLLARVLCVIVRLSQESKRYRPSMQHSNSEEVKNLKAAEAGQGQAIPTVVFAAFMKLFPLLGVTWFVGWLPTFFAGHSGRQCGATEALFFGLTVAHTILNGLQGLFVFIICVLKDKYVRKALKRRLDGALNAGHHYKNSRTTAAHGKKMSA